MQSVGDQLSKFVLIMALITPAAVIADVYQCALPVPVDRNHVLTDLSRFQQNIVLSIYIQAKDSTKLDIDPMILNGLLAADSEHYEIVSALLNNPLAAQIITTQDDTIVASFTNHSLQQTHTAFSGFKALLKTGEESGENKQDTTAAILLRIILDWNYQPYYLSGSTVRVYRAAFVVAQAHLNSAGETIKEQSYRFLPDRRPFRALTCIKEHALDRTLL